MYSRTFTSGKAYGDWLRSENVTVLSVVALGQELVVTFEYRKEDTRW